MSRASRFLPGALVVQLFLPLLLLAQAVPQGGSSELVHSIISPLNHLATDGRGSRTLGTTPSIMPFKCAQVMYYDTLGSEVTHSESLPTSVWAARLTMPSTTIMPCTVWTVYVDFELTGSSASDRDTIQFVLRERDYPYTQIFTTWYLARSGDNIGEFEIDPPAVPPYGIKAIVGAPKRDMLMGYYVRGNSQHSVTFRFREPSIYTNPIRSVRFTTPTSTQSASAAVGTSVDWVFYARLCCLYGIPVELSLFDATVDGRFVSLQWKTASETNNAQFEIQRGLSAEGPWETRGFVPGRGTTTIEQEYAYQDVIDGEALLNNAGAVYYRLVQMDFDGATSESPVIRVLLGSPEAAGFRLSPVWPNPVAMSAGTPAGIRYQLPKETAVRVGVHDALGREVAVLVNRTQPAGMHEAQWYPSAGASLRSGAYFIRLTTPDASAVESVSVVK